MPKKLFVNLPVKDLNRSVEFFTQLGYTFNPQFTDENATCMIISEEIYAMLLVESYFKGFTKKPVADATKTTEVLIALSADSREEVDDLISKALAAGAKTLTINRTMGLCISGVTRISTDISGKYSGWTPRPCRGKNHERIGN